MISDHEMKTCKELIHFCSQFSSASYILNSYIVTYVCNQSKMVWGSLGRWKFVLFKKEGPSSDSQWQGHLEKMMPVLWQESKVQHCRV